MNRRKQPLYFDATESCFFEIKTHQGRRNGMAVRRIEIKVRREYRETLGVGSLYRDKPSCPHFTVQRAKHLWQPLGRKMLGDLATHDAAQRGIGYRVDI